MADIQLTPLKPILADSTGACPLADCAVGRDALVIDVCGSAGDACRLRALGVYEGAELTVVSNRLGLLIEVRGTRLMLGRELARAVGVRPVSQAIPLVADHVRAAGA